MVKKNIYNNQNFGDIYRQFSDSLLKIAIKVNIRILYLIKARMKDICTKYNQSRTSTSGLFCLFICIFVQNITKAGFQYKQRIFFYFVAWLSLIFFDFWWYSQLFGNKSWNPRLYTWSAKKKLTPLGHSAAPSRRRSGPAEYPSGFNLFHLINHLCFKIYCQIFVKPSKIEKKVNETRTQKKLHGLCLKPFRVSSIKKLSNL